MVVGKKFMNRAVHGDRVAVELLSQTDWKKPFDVLPVEEDEEASAGNYQKHMMNNTLYI